LLTTFTKDGRPTATPIWGFPDGDRLLMITDADSWKVKRIRHTPRVTIAVCTFRGKSLSEAIPATATILDKSEPRATQRAVANRYGLRGRLFFWYDNLRRGKDSNVGLEIKPAT
jgi:PPOX class probable F420-dependent enzyme